MIVDKAVYVDGRRQECPDVATAMAEVRGRDDDSFIWVGLFEPSAEQVHEFAEILDMHPLMVEDIITGRQPPKLDVIEGSALMVFSTLAYFEENSDVETGEVLLAWGPHWVLTVRHGKHTRLTGVRARLERSPELMAHGPTAGLFVVIDHIVDTYTRVDQELNDDLLRIERATFDAQSSVDVLEIYRLKREIMEARAAVQPLVDPLRHLIDARDLLAEEMKLYFRDVQDHLLRTEGHVNGYDRTLTDILQAHLSMVAVQQGEDTRKISAWAALAAVPTIVGAVYGMNFDTMPELHWIWGYPAVMVFTVVVVVLLYLRFRRVGWL
ncbi:magnesium and cobalt transport protein CorA [Kytococcus sp. Marseille-QA3725]